MLAITLVLNLAVAVAKGLYALWSGSLAIAADAVHSVFDAGGNVAGLVLLARAARPPDADHPYGYRKLEILGAAAIGVLIGTAALRFGWAAIASLAGGAAVPATSIAGFVIIGVTWVINLFVAMWESREARRLASPYLAADAAHTASDVAVTAAVAVSFTAAHFGVAWADPVGALLVLVIIGRAAWQVLSNNLSVLLDTAVFPPERIIDIVHGVGGVTGVHRVRSRGSPTAAHIDLHVLMANDIRLREAHRIAHAVEAALREQLPGVIDVTVHMEPEEDGYEAL